MNGPNDKIYKNNMFKAQIGHNYRKETSCLDLYRYNRHHFEVQKMEMKRL